MIAEALSRRSPLPPPDEWGVKVVRVIILTENLFRKSSESLGAIADASARDLISNLQQMSLIEPTDEATALIFDIQISDWLLRSADSDGQER